MLLCAEYVLPITSEPIHRGAVLVQGDAIKDIGKADILKLRYPEEEVHDYGRAAIMPGLLDLHSHMENAVLRGLVKDCDFSTWVMNVGKMQARLSAEDRLDSAVLCGMEAVSNGVTTIADFSTTGSDCAAVSKLGMRAFIYREVGAMDKRRVDFAMTAAANDIDRWGQDYGSSLVTIGIAPAEVYSVHPAVFGHVAEFATKENIPMSLHLAGSQAEVDFVRFGSSPFSVHGLGEGRGFVEIPPWMPTGTTPIRYALNWGALEAPNVMVVHAVHADDYDISKLREYGVSVATCPRCNAQLGMGVAPLMEFISNGIPFGFGTDSPAAAGSADILAEIRTGLLIQRAVNVGNFIDASSMLEYATMGAARALKIEDKVGSLEIGKLADIIAVDFSSSRQMPLLDPVSTVVNACSGDDVVMTMINGKVLYEHDEWHLDFDMSLNVERAARLREKLRK